MQSKKIIARVVSAVVFSLMTCALLFPEVALMQITNPIGGGTGDPDIPGLIGNVLRGLFGLIGTIALLFFIYGGFVWMTAFGEESKIKKGWDTMIWSALGLVLIFGSYAAADFILKALLGS